MSPSFSCLRKILAVLVFAFAPGLLPLHGTLLPDVQSATAYFHSPGTPPSINPIPYLSNFSGEPCPSLSSDTILVLEPQGVLRVCWFLQDGTLFDRVVAEDVTQACARLSDIFYIRKDKTLWRRTIDLSNRVLPYPPEESGKGVLSSPELIAKAVSQISAGYSELLFVTTGGDLMLSGSNEGSKYGSFPEFSQSPIKLLSDVKAAYAGLKTGMVILRDNTLWGIGDYWAAMPGSKPVNSGRIVLCKIANDVDYAHTGASHSVFITRDQQLWALGGRLGIRPLMIAEKVVSAVSDNYPILPQGYDSSSRDIHFLTSDGRFFSANPGNDLDLKLHQQGTGVKSLAQYHRGYIINKQGIPLFRFAIPFDSDGSPRGSRPESGVSFITATDYEVRLACAYRSYDGLNHHVLAAPEAGAKPVFRFLNLNNGAHFHTMNEQEIAVLDANARFWDKQVAFYAFDTQIAGTLPVYRFFSERTHSHFYTISEAEKDWILANRPSEELRIEGIAWFALPSP